MKVNLACKNILMSAILTAGIVVSGSSSAGLLNQNFNAQVGPPEILQDWEDWYGEIKIEDGGSISELDSGATVPSADAFFSTYASSFDFSSVTNGVKLNLISQPDYYVYDLYLDQLFDIDPLTTAGNSLFLSFDIISSLTSTDDTIFASLIDDNAVLTDINLLNSAVGGVVDIDITDWAGLTDVILSFGIADGDFDERDTLTISNIEFTQVTASIPVPEPSTYLMLMFSLIVIFRKSLIQKKSF